MLEDIERRLTTLEESLSGIGYKIQNAITSDSTRKIRNQTALDAVYGFQIALVVNTADPLKAGRVQIYHPVFDEETPPPEPDKLSWAAPISVLGGFDDSGVFWPPPAGSKVAIIYKNGNYNDPYYLGTVWDRHRGPDGQHVPYWYNYPYSDEYNCLHEGRRGGYNFVRNDGDQVMPPCNTDAYDGYDFDDEDNFNLDPDDARVASPPHFNILKTTEKHGLKFVNGNPKCNFKGKRVELYSGRGVGIVMKDDHLHPMSQFCYSPDYTAMSCIEELPCCSDGATPRPMIHFNASFCTRKEGLCTVAPDSGCLVSVKATDESIDRADRPSNPFHKREEELRFYRGTSTPGDQKIELPQSGMQLQSLSGSGLILDDSVDQPYGVPGWELGFNTGCNDLLKCKTTLRGATGPFIELNDHEDFPHVRSEDNGIFASTALGNFIKMSDHTVQVGDSCTCPPNEAGARRGITMGTTASNLFAMCDQGLKKCGDNPRHFSPVAAQANEGGYEGFVLLRSGYGLQLLFKDADIQTETKNQFIQLMAPQHDNVARGPHLMVMQEQPAGPGFVILRAGGVLVSSSYDETLEVVGDEDNNPSSKFVAVTEHYLTDVKGYYFNHAQTHVLYSDKYMFLLAGQDCPIPEDPEEALAAANTNIDNAVANPNTTAGQNKNGPCVHQCITSKEPWVCPYTNYVHYGVLADQDGIVLDSRSDRVFVSSSNGDANG